MTPTPEQAAILSGFGNTTGNICVQALAGTGKTSTLLELVAQNPQTSFLYMAFNVAVKTEVEAKAGKRGLKTSKCTQNGFCLELTWRTIHATSKLSRNHRAYHGNYLACPFGPLTASWFPGY